MSDKKILYFLVFSLLIQILFSFYYSGEIINQNNILNQNQNKYNSLKDQNQVLQTELAKNTSLYNLESQISSQSFVPIQKFLDINTDKNE